MEMRVKGKQDAFEEPGSAEWMLCCSLCAEVHSQQHL